MEFIIREDEDFIKLGQLIKACGFVSYGVEAKIVINDGSVTVNGEVCTMRGKKIHRGDKVRFNDNEVRVI